MNIFKNSITNDIELIDIIIENNHTKVEVINSPPQIDGNEIWYDQDADELVFLTMGEAILEFENNEKTSLKVGDYLFIEKHKRHRVAFTSKNPPCTWIAIHFK